MHIYTALDTGMLRLMDFEFLIALNLVSPKNSLARESIIL